MIGDKIFDYFKQKISNFSKTTKNGKYLFSCPNSEKHKFVTNQPSATFIAGTEKIVCLFCGWKGSIYDAVRLLEKDKTNFTDEQIIFYLMSFLKLNNFVELDVYLKHGWSLVPLARNSKNPIETNWTNNVHKNKEEWIKWINNELNIGVRTGEISGITVVDVDLKDESIKEDKIYSLLKKSDTLTQNSPHGKHFFFKYDKDIKQTVNLGNKHIDIRNDKGQVVIYPSKINNLPYSWEDINKNIKPFPEELKQELLTLESEKKEIINNINIEEKILEGERNVTLTSLCGNLIRKLPLEQTQYVLKLINNTLLQTPLPESEIDVIIKSINKYKETEDTSQEKAIFECLKLLKCDIHAKDIVEHTGLKRSIVDKYLSKFAKEGKIIRTGRGIYDFKNKIEWTHAEDKDIELYPYKIPYFDEVAYFQHGDIILLGGLTGKGKTHQALNMVKEMIKQGVKPYYISFESGSRYKKIAQYLGINSDDFYVPSEEITNPLHILLEEKAFTIIDWLYLGDDFTATPKIFNHFKDEMKKRGGILVIFTQLKEDYSWFAKNLIKDFVALSARYVHDDSSGIVGHWDIDKIRDPKGNYLTEKIYCKYNFETKEFFVESKV